MHWHKFFLVLYQDCELVSQLPIYIYIISLYCFAFNEVSSWNTTINHRMYVLLLDKCLTNHYQVKTKKISSNFVIEQKSLPRKLPWKAKFYCIIELSTSDYSMIVATRPDPTVRPPSRSRFWICRYLLPCFLLILCYF